MIFPGWVESDQKKEKRPKTGPNNNDKCFFYIFICFLVGSLVFLCFAGVGSGVGAGVGAVSRCSA